MAEEWVIVNGHVLGHCSYLRSLDKPWEREDPCDCRDLQDNAEVEDDEEWVDDMSDLAYEGGW